MAVDVKPKRRNSEKRKEKSRDAARTRRSKETEIFCQLAHQLPISQNTLALLDKSSIVRLGITHLKLRQLFHNAIFAKPARMLPSCHLKVDHTFSRALDGFLMLVDKDGTLIYITDNVSSHLGLAQVDLLGLGIYDFIHPCDHDEMQDILSNRNIAAKNPSQSIFIRMKCTLTSKGHSVNIKSAYYKVIHCLPSMVSTHLHQQMEPQNLSKSGDRLMSFTLLLCRLLFHPSNTDLLLDSRTFVSHHSMDMSFIYCDDRFSALLGYEMKELLGKSLYQFHHVLDAEAIEKSYKTLFSKGQCTTGLYRFLANRGGYVWMETQSSIIANPHSEKEQFVVCVHFVVSEVECCDQTFSLVQQSSCSDEASGDLQDVAAEVEEIDVDEGVEDDDDGLEEVDDKAIFMTEQILKFAAKPCYQDRGHSFPSTCELVSDKHPVSYRFLAKDSAIKTITDYSQLAPYISVEDTTFNTNPVMTTDRGTAAVDRVVVDPDLYRELAPRLENPLMMKFRDLSSVGEPLHWLSRAEKETAVVPSSGFKTSPPGFPVEDSFDFQTAGGGGGGVVSYSSRGCRRSDLQGFASLLNGSSVLKNLLLKGEDTDSGYRLLCPS